MNASVVYKFQKIYEGESDSIFRFCLVRLPDREHALDVMQETFLRFWQGLFQEKEIRNSRAFLFTVAHHLIIDWYRKKKSYSLDKMLDNKEREFTLPPGMVSDSMELDAEGRYLMERIEELEEGHRQPVYLRLVEDLPPQEIGFILGISANAASVRVSRGLAELRKRTGYDLKAADLILLPK